jgi:hypothetical protein
VLLVIPDAVAHWWAAFEDFFEVRLLVKRRAIHHLIEEIIAQLGVVLALRAWLQSVVVYCLA